MTMRKIVCGFSGLFAGSEGEPEAAMLTCKDCGPNADMKILFWRQSHIDETIKELGHEGHNWNLEPSDWETGFVC